MATAAERKVQGQQALLGTRALERWLRSLDQRTASVNRGDTFAATGNGATVDATAAPVKSFALQVTATGAVTSWTVVLETSLDGTTFTVALTHTNVTGSGVTVVTGAALTPSLYWRVRCSAIVLGGGTNVVAAALGMP